MYITRPRAKSFTVEIKRTGKRSFEPTSVTPKISSDSDLVERVFGSSVTTSAGRLEKLARPHDRAEGSLPSQTPSAAFVSDGVRACTPEPQVRRVLPDLLSVIVDPVQERMKQQAEERAARRRALLESRRSKAAISSDQAPVADHRDSAADKSVPATIRPTATGKPKNYAFVAAMRKARRAGLRTPRLPRGQRWKRRLPKACW